MVDKQQYYEALSKKIETLTARTESGMDTQDRLLAQHEARLMYADALENPEFRADDFRAGMPLHRLGTIARGDVTDIAAGSLIGTEKAVINTVVNGAAALKDIPAALDAAAQSIKTVAKDALSDPINFIHGMTMRQRAELATIYRDSPDINAALAEYTQSKTIATYLMTNGAVGGAKALKNLATLPGGVDRLAITPEGAALPIVDNAAAKGAGNAEPLMHAAMATATATVDNSSASSQQSTRVTKVGRSEKTYQLRETGDGKTTTWAIVKDAPTGDGFRTVEIYQANLNDYAPASLPKQTPALIADYRVIKGYDKVFSKEVAPVELQIKAPIQYVDETASLGKGYALKVRLTKEEVNALLREHLDDALTAIQQDAKAQSGRPYVQAVTTSDQVIEGRKINDQQWYERLQKAGLDGKNPLIQEQRTNSHSSLESAIDPSQVLQNQIALRSRQNGLEPKAVMTAMYHAMENERERQQENPTIEA